MSIETKVKEIIAEIQGIDVSSVTNESSFEDLCIDDIDKVEIIMGIEEEYDIEIEEEATENIDTIQGLIDYVNNIVV